MQQITNIKNLKTAIIQNQEKILKRNIEKHLIKAEEDIERGRTEDAREVLKKWKEQYDI